MGKIKEIKKIRKTFRKTFVVFLRKRPKLLPKFIFKICARIIFNKDGLDTFGAIYGFKTKKIFEYNGVKYKVK